jgi:hypothetical protein
MAPQLFPTNIPSPHAPGIQRLLDLLDDLGNQLAQFQDGVPGTGASLDSIRAQARVLARQAVEAEGLHATLALRRRRLQAARRALLKRQRSLTQRRKLLEQREAQIARQSEDLADRQLILQSLANEARTAPQAAALAVPAPMQVTQLARRRAELEEQAARQAHADRWLEARAVELERALRRRRSEQAQQHV